MFGLPQLAIGEVETTEADDNFSLAVDTTAITAWTPRHLLFHIRTKQAAGNLPVIGLQFNADTADNYQWYHSKGAGTSTADVNSYGGGTGSDNTIRVDRMEVGYAQETNWTHVVGIVVDAFATRSVKHIRWVSYSPEESGTTGHIFQGAGKWDSTAAITSVQLDAAENVDAGSRIELAVVDESYQVDETILGSATLAHSAWDANDGVFNTNNTVASLPDANGDLCMVGNFRAVGERELFHGFNDDFWHWTSNPNTYFYSLKQKSYTYTTGQNDDQNNIGFALHDGNSPANEFAPNVGLVPDYATGSHDRGYVGMTSRMNSTYGYAEQAAAYMYHNRWNNNAALTEWQVDVGYHIVNFAAGSMCSFYKVTDDYNLIERKEISTDTAYFDVTIPDTYAHLEITWTARSDVGGAGGILLGEMTQYLGDSGGVDTTDSNYASRVYRHEGVDNPATTTTGSYTRGANMGLVATTDADANVFSTGWNMIFDYNESVHKTSIGIGGVIENADAYASMGMYASSWHDNDAVTTLRIQATSGDLVAGSVFTIRGVGESAVAAAVAPNVVMF